jgi:hypothetical protein
MQAPGVKSSQSALPAFSARCALLADRPLAPRQWNVLSSTRLQLLASGAIFFRHRDIRFSPMRYSFSANAIFAFLPSAIRFSPI